MSAVNTQRTWVTGEIVYVQYMNTNIRSVGDLLLKNPLLEVWQTSPQAIANATNVVIVFDRIASDTEGGYLGTTGAYYFQTSGWWRCSLDAGVNATTGRFDIWLSVSGGSGAPTIWSTMGLGGTPVASNYSQTVSGYDLITAPAGSGPGLGSPVNCAAFIRQTSGGTVNTSADSTFHAPSMRLEWLAGI